LIGCVLTLPLGIGVIVRVLFGFDPLKHHFGDRSNGIVRHILLKQGYFRAGGKNR
jgi:hypothetical protein